jgi:hypothetical protein
MHMAFVKSIAPDWPINPGETVYVRIRCRERTIDSQALQKSPRKRRRSRKRWSWARKSTLNAMFNACKDQDHRVLAYGSVGEHMVNAELVG